MAATFLVPTGLTFSDIRPGLKASTLTELNKYLTSVNQPTVVEGDANPLVLKLNDFDLGGAAFTRGDAMADLATCGPIERMQHLPLPYVSLIVSVGGDLLGFPVFFEFANESDLDAYIPATFPERTYSELSDPADPDSDPVERTHTWLTWQPTHAPKQYGGKWYKSSETSAEAIPASCWVSAGLTVKTVTEYQTISQAG